MVKPSIARTQAVKVSQFFEIIACGWLLAWFYYLLSYSSDIPPFASEMFWLALTGWLIAVFEDRLCRQRPHFREILFMGRKIWIPLGLFSMAVYFSESLGFDRSRIWEPWTRYQCWIWISAPPLAYFFSHRFTLKLTIIALTTIVIWHFFSIPIEAILGIKFSFQETHVLPRESWILHYQASGLAQARYYYAGFFFPSAYLVIGQFEEYRLMKFSRGKKKKNHDWKFPVLSLLWLIPTFCTQSRALFAGALCASLILLYQVKRLRKLLPYLVGGALAIGSAIYVAILAGSKTPVTSFFTMERIYLKSAFEWPELIIGHSQHANRSRLVEPSVGIFFHSHNDLIEVFWKWGLPALIFYLVFWVGFLKWIFRFYLKEKKFWPLACIFALAPTFLFDLGIMHFEKSIFILFFVAVCVSSALTSSKVSHLERA